MKEELANELLSIIKGCKQGLIKGVDLAAEQAPDIFNQIIIFNITKNILWLIICISILIFSSFVFHRTLCSFRNDDRLGPADLWGGVALSVLFFVLIAVPAFFCAMNYMGYLLKAWLAPKVFIIEYLSEFIK